MQKYVDKAVSWDRLGITFERIRPFQKPDNKRAFLHVFVFLCLLTLSALSVIFSALKGWWLLFALALYVHGSLVPFCENAIHELIHNTMFTKKLYNLFFARVFSLISWRINYIFFTISHSRHHAYTQMEISDGENMIPGLFMRKMLLLKLIPVDVVAFINCSLRLLILKPIIHTGVLKLQPWEERILSKAKMKVVHEIYQWSYITLLFHLGIVLITILTGFWLLPLVITLAPFYGGRWYENLINSTQHNGMDYNNNRFSEVCRSIKLDPFSSFLYFHMEYHIEHHMLASIPCYRLKEFSTAFKEKLPEKLPAFQAILQMLKSSREFWEESHLAKT